MLALARSARLAPVVLTALLLGPGCGIADTPEMAEPDPEAAEAPDVAALALAAEESVLAVITHRAGAAARLAHNHLVVADGPDEVGFSPRQPEATRFAVELRAEALRIDDPALQERWYPRLAELGILDEPFEQPSENDRAKIEKAMLSEGQLDGARHPTLGARLVGVKESPATVGTVAFTHVADVAWTIRGANVQRPMAARWEEKEGVVTLEAVGTLRFTDFGIEPYSAFLGAVRNQDEFHVYLRLVGRSG